MNISRVQVKWVILLCSIISYILSLFPLALLYENQKPLTGGWVLVLGWMGIIGPGFAWLANPFYFFAVIAYIIVNSSLIAKRPNDPLFLTVIALVLGVTSFLAIGHDLGLGPGGTVIGLGIGFYVWMLSFLILLIGCLIPSAPKPPAPPNSDAPIG